MFELTKFEYPKWIETIENIPKYRMNFIKNLPTLIEEIKIKEIKEKENWNKETKIFIKRDDYTEFFGSGNKIRKLEFVFAKIIQEGNNFF
jgi:1-aminocyclopropane-1-carboxylate deaminase/D-cysteine desulfhydrase-like pyridoxal-dependent ACC family enzyme